MAQPSKLVDRRVVVGEEIQGGMEKGVDLRVVVAQHMGVVGVGGRAFEAVEDQFLQPGDVFAQCAAAARAADPSPGPGGPGPPCRRRAARRPVRRATRGVCPPYGRRRHRAAGPGRASRRPAPSSWRSRCGIEIDIGDGGEEGLDHELVDSRDRCAPNSAARWAYMAHPWWRGPAGLAGPQGWGLCRKRPPITQPVPLAVSSH